MKLTFNNSSPIFEQIAEVFKHEILLGNMPPGSRVKPVRELAIEYGANPNTLQRALSILESEGLFYTERTSGRFVTHDEQIIEALRDKLYKKTVQDFTKKLRCMGMHKSKAKDLIEKYWEEEDESNL